MDFIGLYRKTLYQTTTVKKKLDKASFISYLVLIF